MDTSIDNIEIDINNINSLLTTIDTSLNSIETDANTLASAISSSEMHVNIMSLTAFTTGIGNAVLVQSM